MQNQRALKIRPKSVDSILVSNNNIIVRSDTRRMLEIFIPVRNTVKNIKQRKAKKL